jgi:hypothetical protein
MDHHPAATRQQLQALRPYQSPQGPRILLRPSQRASLADIHIRANHGVRQRIFPTSNTEMGQLVDLQMFKQEPLMSVDETEAVTPAATYGEVYNCGVATPGSGARETNIPALPQIDPSRYKEGQAEGLGLLQSPDRPVMQNREVSRKPVARQSL